MLAVPAVAVQKYEVRSCQRPVHVLVDPVEALDRGASAALSLRIELANPVLRLGRHPCNSPSFLDFTHPCS